MSNLPVYSTLPQLLHFLFFSCQTGYIKQACMFWPWSRQTLISHTLLPPGFLRIALCRFRHMCRWAWLCDCIWIYLWVLSCLYNRTADWHLHLCRICASVLWSGHSTMYFHMTDGCVDLQQEAWLHCFTISLETRTLYTNYGALSAFCAMDASLPVVGTSTRRREGAPRLKWTPETSWRGRGVANVCFGHGLCQRV